METVLDYARSRQSAVIALIRRMVECESPSGDAAAIGRFMDLVADEVSGIAAVHRFAGEGNGPHLRCEFKPPGRRESGRILVLGHADTVWPLGTLGSMPFRERDGRLWGPGVLDMKSGIAFFLYAVRALRDLGLPVARKVVLLLNSDEETGSATSRTLIEREARRSRAVLVLEPGTGLDGRLKTSRKGVGEYLVTVRGRAAHAGVDFASGANAIVELARQIEKIAGFTRARQGVTVSPGIIFGGTRTNVVPAEASVRVDIRVPRARDAAPLDRKFRGLRPFDPRCVLGIEGGLNRPPMERLPGTVELFRAARALAREMGVRLEESSSGGGSDGNFTAALGVPTLDGLGGVGEGAHASGESILIGRIADRIALLAGLLRTI